jgi:hypothetical protein
MGVRIEIVGLGAGDTNSRGHGEQALGKDKVEYVAIFCVTPSLCDFPSSLLDASVKEPAATLFVSKFLLSRNLNMRLAAFYFNFFPRKFSLYRE